MSKPKVSVIIPTLGRLESLEVCLDSLVAQTFRDFEVIIVDGGKNQAVSQLPQRYPTLNPQVVRQSRPFLIGAIMEGCALSRGEIFVRTDDDIKASAQWLAEVVKTFDSDPKIGGVTGPTTIPDEFWESRDLTVFNRKMSSGKNPFWWLIGKFYHGYVMEGQPFAVGRFFRSGAFSLGSNYPDCLKMAKEATVDYLESCNWCCRKTLIDEIGGFDPVFEGAAEYFEADAVHKIKDLGYRMVFNPRAAVSHRPSKVGAFSARSGSYSRMANFLTFYFRHLRPQDFDHWLRFLSYLAFQNIYYTYIFLRTAHWPLLGCYRATIKELPKLIRKKRKP